MLDALRNFFEKLIDDQPPDPSLFGVSPKAPNEDPAPEINVADGIEKYDYHAEGQTFAIEYLDSKGEPSTRVITVWKIDESSSGGLLLKAWCHLRDQQRSFRIDRIRAVIDVDGEIHEPPNHFLAEALGIPANLFRAEREPSETAQKRRLIREIIRRPTTLLSLLAKADYHWDANEMDVALRYVDLICGDAGVFLDDRDLKYIEGYLKRQRTDAASVETVILAIENWSARSVQKLLLTCKELAEADGEFSAGEAEVLQGLAHEILGTEI